MEDHGKQVEAYLREAQTLLLEDDRTNETIEAAITAVSKGLFLAPLDAKLYAVRAEAYVQLHDVDSAIQDLRYVVLRRDGADAGIRHRLAMLLSMQGHWATSPETRLACFDEAAKLDPLCPDHFVDCAVAQVQLHDLNAAFQNVTRAIKLEKPTAKNASTGDFAYEPADYDVDDRRETGPTDKKKRAEHHVLRGKIAWALGLMETGVQDMRVAQKLDFEHPEVRRFSDSMLSQSMELSSKAMVAMANQEYDDAIKQLTAALNLAPDDMKLMISRGAAYRLRGDLDLAETDLDNAATAYHAAHQGSPTPPVIVVSDENSVTPFAPPTKDFSMNFWVEPYQLVRQRNLVWNERALRDLGEGRHLAAITRLNYVIEAEKVLVARKLCDVVDHRFLVNRGACHFARGDLVLATADFQRALDVCPVDVDPTDVKTRLSMTHYKTGLACFNDGDFWDAQFEFTQAIKLNPRVAEYYANRGIAYYHQQCFDEARQDFVHALSLNPNLPHIRVRLQQFGGLEKSQPKKPPVQYENSTRLPAQRHRPTWFACRRDSTPLAVLQAVRPPSGTQRDRQRPTPGYVAQIPRGFQAVVSEKTLELPKVKTNVRIPKAVTRAVGKRSHAEDKLAHLRRSNGAQARDAQLWSVLRSRTKKLPS